MTALSASPKSPVSRGWRRMRELNAQAEAERQALVEEIVAGLGRAPTALDRIAIESVAAAAIRARRLRAMGRDDLEVQRLLAQLLRATGLRPDRPTAPAPMSLQDQLRLRGYEAPANEPPSDPDDETDAEEAGDETPAGEPASASEVVS